jgi:Helix-turn-helix domain
VPRPSAVKIGSARLLKHSRPSRVAGSPWRGRRELLTVPEAAKELAVCTSMVYELVAPGDLAPVRELNAARARRDHLDAFAARIT